LKIEKRNKKKGKRIRKKQGEEKNPKKKQWKANLHQK
jgi:hypothetical protein